MITVLLATHNGERRLPITLAGLAAQSGAAPWQLIVIDDGSTDGTPKVIQSFAAELPLCHLTQQRGGKSAALNRGLLHANGDVCVFIDDDVELPEDFLVRYEGLIAEHPDFDVFGARIEARWPASGGTPGWLVGEEEILSAAYGHHPCHLKPGPSSMDWIWGANYAVRKRALEGAGQFDPRIGPGANARRQGCELEFNLRLEKSGMRAWFSDTPRVRHIIRSEQLCLDWLRARGFAYGRQQFASTGEHTTGRVLGYPRWLVRSWVRAALAEFAARAFGRTDAALRQAWRRGLASGMLHESRRQRTSV